MTNLQKLLIYYSRKFSQIKIYLVTNREYLIIVPVPVLLMKSIHCLYTVTHAVCTYDAFQFHICSSFKRIGQFLIFLFQLLIISRAKSIFIHIRFFKRPLIHILNLFNYIIRQLYCKVWIVIVLIDIDTY